MADTTHKGYTAAIASVLTTELNSLANNGVSAASAAIDNTTALDLFADLTFTIATQGVARSTGAHVDIYIIQALDGTNYDGITVDGNEPVAVFTFNAATTTWQTSRRNIDIPPGLYKYYAVNVTGQTLAASGNILEHRMHSIKSV